MKKFVKKISLVLSVAVMLCSLGHSGCAAEPIGIYDLRYATRIDASDPAQVKMAWDHCHAAATLQGIVNRDKPRLYLRFVDSQHGSRNVDDYWLDQLRQPGQWLAGRETKTIPNILELIQTYRPFLKGAVVYDPKVTSTSNVASAIAGVEDLLAIRYDPSPDSLYTQLIQSGPKLPVKVWLLQPDGQSLFTGRGEIPGLQRPSTGSAKCDAYLWMKHRYMDTQKCNNGYGAYYLDQYWMQKPQSAGLNHHTLTNHDFFVSKRAFFFDLNVWPDEATIEDLAQKPGTDLETLKELLLTAYNTVGKDKMVYIGGFPAWAFKYTQHAGGRHGDVETEWQYATIISAYNAFKDADAIGYGAMANASFYAHFPLKKKYPQPWVTHEQLRQRGYLTDDGQVNFDGREFVILYVGDYDAASWVYQRTMDIWDDPARGQVPLMWCISPVLEQRAGPMLDYMRQTATPNDYFAAADNGAGYLNPGLLQEPRPISSLPSGLDAWADHCLPYYQRWDLSITGFIIDGSGPAMNDQAFDCYARFSPNGIVPQKVPATLLHGNLPILRHDWDINQEDPAQAAQTLVQRIQGRQPLHFHWFRNILKTPAWYVQVHQNVKKECPQAEFLDAPTFFELYRIYLQTTPAAAQGKIKIPWPHWPQ